MIISHKYKFIFIKTRKTAGSSIERYLVDHYLGPDDICTGSDVDGMPAMNIQEGVNGHCGWRWIKKHYPYEWANYYKFAVERNPWDAMISRYYWYKHKKPGKVNKPFRNWINAKTIHRYNDWNMYADHDEILVDALIQYEKLARTLSKNKVIPHRGELHTYFIKSGYRPRTHYYWEYYDRRSRDFVAYAFKKQIELFNYKFKG